MATFQMNFLSRQLGMMTNISVILPSLTPADAVAERKPFYRRGIKFQTLWLLHDYTGDDGDFMRYTSIARYAEMNQLAVIMPCDYNKMYTDAPGSSRFFSYIVEELPVLCRAFFPLSDKREDNFIGGIGMGAAGALKAALRYPGQYAAVLALSEGFGPPDQNQAWLDWQGELKREGKVIAAVPDDVPAWENDLTIQASLLCDQDVPLPRIVMAWGEHDSLVADRAASGAEWLSRNGYDVDAKAIVDAGRDWDFWDWSLSQAIESWLGLKRSPILPE